jgi:hypothetical protein
MLGGLEITLYTRDQCPLGCRSCVRPSTDRPPTDRRVTVIEAASILGITPDAVRKGEWLLQTADPSIFCLPPASPNGH